MTNVRLSRIRDKLRHKRAVCVERGWWMTQAYLETEGLPSVLRRAKALKKIIENMKVQIDEEELIVGKATSKTVGAPIIPELQWQMYVEQLDLISKRDIETFSELTEAERNQIYEIVEYWKGKTLYDMWWSKVADRYKQGLFKIWSPGGANPLAGIHLAHCCPGFDLLIKWGIEGLQNFVYERKKSLMNYADEKQAGKTKEEVNKKLHELEAMEISLEALKILAMRYGELARVEARRKGNCKRARELDEISYNCEHISQKPPENFHQALQLVWFGYVAVMLEGWGPGIGFGRMDQYLLNYYLSDKKRGRLDQEKAIELLACFLLKINELAMPYIFASTQKGSALLPLSVITLGGVNTEGVCAVNELSYLFLKAEKLVRLQEEFAIRISSDSPDDFLREAVDIAKSLVGKLKFVGDKVAIEQLMRQGKPLEIARDYAITGCFIHTVPGKSFDPGADFFNLAMVLELTLNEGRTLSTQEKIGKRIPLEVMDFASILSAFKEQFAFLLPYYIEATNIYRELFAEYFPYPLMSTLFDGCIEQAKDVSQGGARYNTTSIWVCGIPNVGDSLAAIKKWVFEDKKFSLDQVIKAIKANYEGYDEVHWYLENAPKFGNDNDYVDKIVNEVIIIIQEEVEKYEGPFGNSKYTVAAGNVVANVSFGKVTGALPDGRRAGQPLAEGGISPHQGRNRSGITSTLKSVCKLELSRTSAAVLNLMVNPDLLVTQEKLTKFVSLLRTFEELGGDIIQFNIVSRDTLKRAQYEPENYRDLLVRVATYSAYFVELPKDIQDDIIARTEFVE
ncbi:MAG: pyruvate formate lyase family protein [candidate division WOR-3 bacterium]